MGKLVEGVNHGIHRYVDQVQLNMKRRNEGVMHWEKRSTGEEGVNWNQGLNMLNDPNKSNHLSIDEVPKFTFSDKLADVRTRPIPNYGKEATQVENGNTKKLKEAVSQAPVQAVTTNKNVALTQAMSAKNFIGSMSTISPMTGVNGAYPTYPAYPYAYNYGSPNFNQYLGGLNGYYPFYTVTPSVDKLY